MWNGLRARSNRGIDAIHKETMKGEEQRDVIEFWFDSERLLVYEATLTGLFGKIHTKGLERNPEKALSEYCKR